MIPIFWTFESPSGTRARVMGKEIVPLPNKDSPSQWQDQREYLSSYAMWNDDYLLPEVTVVRQAMRVSFALLRVLLTQ